MLPVGSAAPPFDLPDETGARHRLEEVLRHGPLVLYLYPADFTPVCTKQACLFRDARQELADAGVRVLGLSPQGVASHERFAKRHSLGFPLLADPEKRTIRAYGGLGLFGLMTKRVSYYIDAGGIIRDAEHADWRLARHAGFVDRVLRLARSGAPDQAPAAPPAPPSAPAPDDGAF